LLKYGKEKQALIAQIEARQKARNKLPSWFAEPRLVFPAGVSVEQSSSEITAEWKASLINGTLIDATGGMGIDTYFFAQQASEVIYIEQNENLVRQARHNFGVFNQQNITCICADSIAFLSQYQGQADWIYIDPARRSADNRRVVGLADCEPDITQHLDLFFQKAKRLLVKASPLLDISQTLQDLPQISTIYVVAVENECKELVFELQPSLQSCLVKTVNFKSDRTAQVFDFQWDDEPNTAVRFSEPLTYIYEPNAAVMKAGAFRIVAASFDCHKIAPHSHLYTSEVLKPDFPGRIFRLKSVIKVDNKALIPFLTDQKANLTLRNFPGSTDELRKKLKLKDGGDVYLLATTLSNGDKRLLVCEKVNINDF